MDKILDYSIRKGMKAADLADQMASAGFQASGIGEAARIIGKMKEDGATVFLSFTANMVATGLRGIIAQMVRDKLS